MIGNVILDKPRAREKVDVHHQGDHRQILDMTRTAFLLQGDAGYRNIRPYFDERADLEVVDIEDRFEVPALNQYRDMKVRVRLRHNGYITTFRFVIEAMLDSHKKSIPADARLAAIEAVAQGPSSGALVVTSDLFNYQEPEGRTLIQGFPDFECARKYADLRFSDSISFLSEEAESAGDLLTYWLVFGEDAVAIDPTGAPGFYHASADFFNQTGDEKFDLDRDWVSYERTLNLGKSPLPLTDN